MDLRNRFYRPIIISSLESGRSLTNQKEEIKGKRDNSQNNAPAIFFRVINTGGD